MKRRRKIVLTILSIIILLLGTLMYLPTTLRAGAFRDEYSDVLGRANLAGDTRIVDIAMLGAHDAFSSHINLFSKPDPAEDGIVANKFVNGVFKGGLVRVLRAQQDNAATLLKRGVRYFDVRISYSDGKWYTKHGLLDNLLVNYVADIYTFLKDKPNEFIIFDIQHIYTGTQTISDFLDYFAAITLTNGNLSLNSFINYPTSIPLGELEYIDVKGTNHGGIIVLLNNDGSATFDNEKLFYNRGNGEDLATSVIRSKWHNQTSLKTMIPLIEEEALFLEGIGDLDFLRVNQAQLTPDYMRDALGTLWGWSLINIAAKSNKELLSHENFKKWLDIMPIFMVDFANSNSGNFNKLVNEQIIAHNLTLSA